MKYQSERRKKNLREVQEQIVKLWMKCSTWEEFKVRVSLNVPEARWRDLFACKLHWLRKSYPVAYRFSWCVAMPALIWSFSFAFFCLTEGMTEDSIANSILASIAVYLIIIFFHLAFVGDFMRTLEWNEEGRPIDY